MAECSLTALVERGLAQRVIGDGSVVIRGIKHDSRRIEPGDLFAAVPGTTLDAAEFVHDAIARGAVAVAMERPFDVAVPVLVADDMLVALSAIARHIYEDPTANLPAIG